MPNCSTFNHVLTLQKAFANAVIDRLYALHIPRGCLLSTLPCLSTFYCFFAQFVMGIMGAILSFCFQCKRILPVSIAQGFRISGNSIALRDFCNEPKYFLLARAARRFEKSYAFSDSINLSNWRIQFKNCKLMRFNN